MMVSLTDHARTREHRRWFHPNPSETITVIRLHPTSITEPNDSLAGRYSHRTIQVMPAKNAAPQSHCDYGAASQSEHRALALGQSSESITVQPTILQVRRLFRHLPAWFTRRTPDHPFPICPGSFQRVSEGTTGSRARAWRLGGMSW